MQAGRECLAEVGKRKQVVPLEQAGRAARQLPPSSPASSSSAASFAWMRGLRATSYRIQESETAEVSNPCQTQ